METVKLVACWSMAIIAVLAYLSPIVAKILMRLYDMGKLKKK